MEDINKIFQASVEQLLDKTHGNQIKLAKQAEIDPTYLNRILKGSTPSTDATRRAIATALGFSGREYEEFLDIGRAILSLPKEEHNSIDEEYDKCIDDIFVASLKTFLKRRGSQRALSIKTGLRSSYISQIVTGKKYGSEEARRTLASALGFPGRKYEDFLDIGREILSNTKEKHSTLAEEHEKHIDEIFRLAVNNLLPTKRGAKAEFARRLEIDQGYLSKILQGSVTTSETKKREIAAVLGYDGEKYDDLITIGRQLFFQETIDQIEQLRLDEIPAKSANISELEAKINLLEEALKLKDESLKEKGEALKEKDEALKEKDKIIEQQKALIEQQLQLLQKSCFC